MEQRILDLLRTADDPDNCEYPPDFDREKAMQRVQNLKPELDSIAGEPFKMDQHVEDASFFTELTIEDRKSSTQNITYILLGIRFSCFGNLFTIGSSSPTEHLAKEKIRAIIEVVKAHGFIYVDGESLAEPYTGSNRYLQHLSS